ncbi:hypothetical protein BH11MYX1_BH11MYX1_05400 [soil metagenome]
MEGFALVLVAASSRVALGHPLAVRTGGELPFSREELDAALGLRTQLADASSPRQVDAQVTGDLDDVVIAVMGRTRRVPLEGQHGADAARLVAFALLDLAGAELDPPAGARVQERSPEPSPRIVTTAPLESEPPSRAPAWSTGLVASAGTRNEMSLELGARLFGPVRAIGSVGMGTAIVTTATPAASTITRQSFPLRLSLAWRRGAFEARAGAVAVIEQASAARAKTEVTAGGGAAATWSLIRFHDLVGSLGAGLDGFATSIDYRVNEQRIVTTPRIGWWGGLCVAWEMP